MRQGFLYKKLYHLTIKPNDVEYRDSAVLSRCRRARRASTAWARSQRWTDNSRRSADLARWSSTGTSPVPRRCCHARRPADWLDPATGHWPRRTRHVTRAGRSRDDTDDVPREMCRLRPTASRLRLPSFLPRSHNDGPCEMMSKKLELSLSRAFENHDEARVCVFFGTPIVQFRVQLFADASNGWSHRALRIFSSFQSDAASVIVKAPLVLSPSYARSAIASTGLYLYLSPLLTRTPVYANWTCKRSMCIAQCVYLSSSFRRFSFNQ